MQDRIFYPITTEEALLSIRLLNQGADAFYLAEIRLAEKMKPARLAKLETAVICGASVTNLNSDPVFVGVLPVKGSGEK